MEMTKETEPDLKTYYKGGFVRLFSCLCSSYALLKMSPLILLPRDASFKQRDGKEAEV